MGVYGVIGVRGSSIFEELNTSEIFLIFWATGQNWDGDQPEVGVHWRW